ncbi:diacylglycerol kinase [Streptomyces sp. MS06]|uniref:diacylglycerol kinase n=1 Tax=Streptomyces sp. MS06 TaxID=3385974 RepID=UPI0039A2DFA6
MATFATSDQLLVIIDPVARRADGEAVRIAKDVLSAGAATKVCLPDDPEEFARALARRGSRRPVVVGDDRAFLRTVSLLHRQRELAGCPLSVVPVGPRLSVSRSLGLPTGAVTAARAVLDGVEQRRDLLVDDSDGVVLGAVGIPPAAVPQDTGEAPAQAAPWLRTCRSLVRTLVPARPGRADGGAPGPSRIRVEVDGVTVVDLGQPVAAVSVTPGDSGVAEVEVRSAPAGSEEEPVRTVGRTVSVSGEDFRYRADAGVCGPVRRRTWTVREGELGLVVPG